MLKRTFFTLCVACIALVMSNSTLSAQQQIYDSYYNNDADCNFYRIPGIAVAVDGTVFLVNDNRHKISYDIGGDVSNPFTGVRQTDIDLCIKYRNYNATTAWTELIDFTNNRLSGYCCFGDPAIVADCETNEVLILEIVGDGKRSDCCIVNKKMVAIKGTKTGNSWNFANPVLYDEAHLPTTNLSYSGKSYNDIKGMFVASGRICQSRRVKVGSHYRLYMAVLASTGALPPISVIESFPYSWGDKINYIFYSDDFGTTWHFMGGPNDAKSSDAKYMDEAKVEELSNGDLMLSTRQEKGRAFSKFTFSTLPTTANPAGAGSWVGKYTRGLTAESSSTITTNVNGDFIKVKAKDNTTGTITDLFLQSTATRATRQDIKIFYRPLSDNSIAPGAFGVGWTAGVLLPNTSNGNMSGQYSTMAVLPNGKIAVYYEYHDANKQNVPIGDIYNNLIDLGYIEYTLEQITNNKYSIALPFAYSRTTADGLSAEPTINGNAITAHVVAGGRMTVDSTDFTIAADGRLTIENASNNVYNVKVWDGIYHEDYVVTLVEDADDNNTTTTTPTTTTSVFYRWIGTKSDLWNDATNWEKVQITTTTAQNVGRNMSSGSSVVLGNFVPDANSDVVIANTLIAPVVSVSTTIRNLYIAPGARLGNQYLLTITGGAYVDVRIPSNKWVRVCMPLQDAYSGDMFTYLQGGKQLSAIDYFVASTYEPVDGNGGDARNRVFPYSVYQRVFADMIDVKYNTDATPNYADEHIFTTTWSLPFNTLNREYQDAEGFDLWAPSTGDSATFRFPSSCTTYYYYGTNGNQIKRNESGINRANSSKPAYHPNVNGVMTQTLIRSKENDKASTPTPMYAVGNPSFAYLDIKEFIRVNAYGSSAASSGAVGNITPYLYRHHEGEDNEREGHETVYFYDRDGAGSLYLVDAAISENALPDKPTSPTIVDADNPDGYIAPTRGFRVMAGHSDVVTLEPMLIGEYTTSRAIMAQMRYGTSKNNLNKQSNSTPTGAAQFYLGAGMVSTESDGRGINSSMVIAPGATPDSIIISNFIHQGIVKARIDADSKKIYVKNGTEVGMQTMNGTTWYPKNGGTTISRYIYLWDGTSRSTTSSQVNGNYTQYASVDRTSTADIVFDYVISDEGSVTIVGSDAFAIYVNDTEQTTYHSDGYCLAWNAFTHFTAKTMRGSSVNQDYMLPELFGTYSVDVSSSGNTYKWPKGSRNITIHAIPGSFSKVAISGFYFENGSTATFPNAFGYVRGSKASGYFLVIPGGQKMDNSAGIVNGGSFAHALYESAKGTASPCVYTHDNSKANIYRREDLVFDIHLESNGLYLTFRNEGKATNPSSNSITPVIQIGKYDCSISGGTTVTGDGYWMSGISYKTQPIAAHTETATVNITILSVSGNNYGYRYDCDGYTELGSVTVVNATQISLQDAILNDIQNVKQIAPQGKPSGSLSGTAVGSTATLTWTIYVQQEKAKTVYNAIPRTSTSTGGSSSGSGTDINDAEIKVGNNYSAINLKFTSDMFVANIPTKGSKAPSNVLYKATPASNIATITLQQGKAVANSVVLRNNVASNGYNYLEDAAIIDVPDNAPMLATLAGKCLVAVNTVNDTNVIQLYISGISGTFTLDIDNIKSIGNNARLYDAVFKMYIPLNSVHASMQLRMSVNDSPLRYSIVYDAPIISGNDNIELDEALFDAYSVAKGTIKVVAEGTILRSVKLFDASGKLVDSHRNSGDVAYFEYLIPGVYFVEVTDGAKHATIKVEVK